jgi:lysophospholipase L1-like esterase
LFALNRVVVAAVVTWVALFGVLVTGTTQTTARTVAATQSATVAQSLHGAGHYVALGDSFAAGPFIPVQRTDPIGCARSTRNYPALIAEGLDVGEFTDVSCSAAVTENMTAPQPVPLGSNPPQFDALRSDTDLVTVTISGNDIGFYDIILTCGRLSVTDPLGDPCKRQATADGTDRYAERIIAAAPKVAEVLRGIRERSPDATVLLVGYLRILPPTIGCWPAVPAARGDVPYLDGIQEQLTGMLATQAEENGAQFVDAYTASLRHDACQASGAKWVESMILTAPGFWVHPNAEGMRAVADLTLGTLISSPN